MIERWKPTHHANYEASDQGRIRHAKTHRVRAPYVHKRTGYVIISFAMGGGVSKSFKAHRLVWEAFNGPIPSNLTVDHTNGDRLDNSLANLRLLSLRENISDGQRRRYGKAGHLTPALVRKIRKDPRLQREIAAAYDISGPTVSQIKTGRTWRDA